MHQSRAVVCPSKGKPRGPTQELPSNEPKRIPDSNGSIHALDWPPTPHHGTVGPKDPIRKMPSTRNRLGKNFMPLERKRVCRAPRPGQQRTIRVLPNDKTGTVKKVSKRLRSPRKSQETVQDPFPKDPPKLQSGRSMVSGKSIMRMKSKTSEGAFPGSCKCRKW